MYVSIALIELDRTFDGFDLYCYITIQLFLFYNRSYRYTWKFWLIYQYFNHYQYYQFLLVHQMSQIINYWFEVNSHLRISQSLSFYWFIRLYRLLTTSRQNRDFIIVKIPPEFFFLKIRPSFGAKECHRLLGLVWSQSRKYLWSNIRWAWRHARVNCESSNHHRMVKGVCQEGVKICVNSMNYWFLYGRHILTYCLPYNQYCGGNFVSASNSYVKRCIKLVSCQP